MEIQMVGRISFIKSSEVEEVNVLNKLNAAGFIAGRSEGEIWFIKAV